MVVEWCQMCSRLCQVYDNTVMHTWIFFISGKEIMFSVICFLLSVFFEQHYSKSYEWIAILWKGPWWERSKWLNFSGDLDHDLASVEVHTLWVLRIWWLSVAICWRRSVTGWMILQVQIRAILRKWTALSEICALWVLLFQISNTTLRFFERIRHTCCHMLLILYPESKTNCNMFNQLGAFMCTYIHLLDKS